jgi:hypothetical protein
MFSDDNPRIWAGRLARVALAAAFLVAGVAKAASPFETIHALVPHGRAADVTPVVAAVIFADVAIGAGLLLGARQCWTTFALVACAVYSAWLVFRGVRSGWNSSCGCGLSEVSVLAALGRNALLVALAYIARPFGESPGPRAALPSP